MFVSCGDVDKGVPFNDEKLSGTVFYDLDTISVETPEELIKNIRSNRVIRLVNHQYFFPSTLLIDGIHNLKIAGDGAKLMVKDGNTTVLQLLNSNNIQLDGLLIGHSVGSAHVEGHGALSIRHSNHIDISNCKLLGFGTFGLLTYNVRNLKFSDSEITESTILIFELEKSKAIEFRNSKFQHNNLAVSVLGAFTNGTKEVNFINCDFLNNTPAMIGNPAFNFMDNVENLDKPIVFTNCRFKNNKGFKWYRDKIELKDCIVDSTDFINFHENTIGK